MSEQDLYSSLLKHASIIIMPHLKIGSLRESESEVAQSCPTLRDPMDCSLPGSSVHGIFQARVLEWGAIAFSVRIETVPFFLFPWFTVTTSFWWGKQTRFGSPGGKGGSCIYLGWGQEDPLWREC